MEIEVVAVDFLVFVGGVAVAVSAARFLVVEPVDAVERIEAPDGTLSMAIGFGAKTVRGGRAIFEVFWSEMSVGRISFSLSPPLTDTGTGVSESSNISESSGIS